MAALIQVVAARGGRSHLLRADRPCLPVPPDHASKALSAEIAEGALEVGRTVQLRHRTRFGGAAKLCAVTARAVGEVGDETAVFVQLEPGATVNLCHVQPVVRSDARAAARSARPGLVRGR